jgi:hypothetical protein
MLLEECFVAFEGDVVAPLAAAVAARLQEAAAARAAGREDWWKLREAALLAVGTVSDSLIAAAAAGGGRSALDVAGLMGAVLAEDLVPTAPPFLIGRALWVTSRCGLSGQRGKERELVAGLHACDAVLLTVCQVKASTDSVALWASGSTVGDDSACGC